MAKKKTHVEPKIIWTGTIEVDNNTCDARILFDYEGRLNQEVFKVGDVGGGHFVFEFFDSELDIWQYASDGDSVDMLCEFVNDNI